MALYSLEPERRTLHGSFSREYEPVLTIDSGDTVQFRTLDAGWGLEAHQAIDIPRKKFEPRHLERDRGHALCGPVYIRGAERGMTLGIRIDDIRPGAWGWTAAGGWSNPVNERLDVVKDEALHIWTLDADKSIGHNQHGHSVALRPFMGIMGMPPDEPGIHSTRPPRVTGGNLDCKELVAGSTLYLPIAVPGALFSTGDGHALQADGEAGGTGIECPIERTTLTFQLYDTKLSYPRAETPAGWITFGLHEDLHEAIYTALDQMLILMHELFGLARLDALALASLVVDLRVTQVVNGVQGAHALLPSDALVLRRN